MQRYQQYYSKQHRKEEGEEQEKESEYEFKSDLQLKYEALRNNKNIIHEDSFSDLAEKLVKNVEKAPSLESKALKLREEVKQEDTLLSKGYNLLRNVKVEVGIVEQSQLLKAAVKTQETLVDMASNLLRPFKKKTTTTEVVMTTEQQEKEKAAVNETLETLSKISKMHTTATEGLNVLVTNEKVPAFLTVKEMGPVEDMRFHKEMGNKLISLLQDKKLSYWQKSKMFVGQMATYTGVKAAPWMWNLTMKFLYQHRYQILGHLAAGVLGTYLFSLLAPAAGTGVNTLGLMNYLVESGLPQSWGGFLVSGLGMGLLSGAKSLGMEWAWKAARESTIFGPFLRTNLLDFEWIQKTLSRFKLPNNWKSFTPEDAIKLLEYNMPLMWSSGAFRNFTIGDQGSWEKFLFYKGLNWAVIYGAPFVAKVGGKVLNPVYNQIPSYRSTKRMVRSMFRFFDETIDMAREKLANNTRLQNTESQTQVFMNQRLAETTAAVREGRPAPTVQEDVQAALPAIQEDLKNPKIVSLAENVFEDVAQGLANDFDKMFAEQQKKDPLSTESVAFLAHRPPPSKPVHDEQAFSLGWLSYASNTRSAAILSGALMFTAIAARAASGEQVSSLLPEAMGASAKNLVEAMIGNAKEHINAEMIMYQLMSNVIGIPTLIQKLTSVIPVDRIPLLKKLQEKIGNNTRNLTNEKHPFIRQFFNVIIGRKIYSSSEVNELSKEELIQLLTDAGAKVPSRTPSLKILKKAVLDLQEHNIKEIHRILFNAITVQLAGTVGTQMAVKAGLSAYEQWRGAARTVADTPKLATAAGLTDLEAKAFKAVAEAEDLQRESSDDILLGHLTTPGTIKDAAFEEALTRGPVWSAAVSAMKKIETFLGVNKPPPLERTSINDLKDAQARQNGFQNAAAMEANVMEREKLERLKGLDQEAKEASEQARKANVQAIQDEEKRLREEEERRKADIKRAKAEAEARHVESERQRELVDERFRRNQEKARAQGFKNWAAMRAHEAAQADAAMFKRLGEDKAEVARIRRELDQRAREKDEEEAAITARGAAALAAQQAEAQAKADALKALGKERLEGVEGRVGKAQGKAGHRVAESDLEMMQKLEDDLKAKIEADDTLKELGFLEHFDQVKDLLRGHGVLKMQAGPDVVTNDPKKGLDPELAKALDIKVMPAAYYAAKRAMEAGEDLVKGVGIGALYFQVKETYNQAIDIAETSMTVYGIMRALLRSNAATKDSTLVGLLPEARKDLFMRIKDWGNYLSEDPAIQGWLEDSKVDLARVVGVAAYKRATWGISTAEMVGEIAGILIAGKEAGAAGAYTGQKTADTIALASRMISSLNAANAALPSEQKSFLGF